MKMTVDIPDDLHKKLKIKAAKNKVSIKSLIIDYLVGEFGKSKDQKSVEKSRDQKNVEKILGKRKNAL